MVNFTVNRRWTFGCHGPADFWPHLARFGMVYLLSYGGSSGFLWFFIEVGRLGAVQAKIAAEGATFLFNFFALRVWAFRPASAFTIRRPTCDIAIRAGSLLRK
jgi:putative flippase GtrA